MNSVLTLLGHALHIAEHPTVISNNILTHPNRNKRVLDKVGIDLD